MKFVHNIRHGIDGAAVVLTQFTKVRLSTQAKFTLITLDTNLLIRTMYVFFLT